MAELKPCPFCGRVPTSFIDNYNLVHNDNLYDKGRRIGLNRSIVTIKAVPAADVQPVDRWISIEESKPKDMQQVLAYVDGDVREAFYNAGCFIGSNFYRSIDEVKMWQPLPEPPTAEATKRVN